MGLDKMVPYFADQSVWDRFIEVYKSWEGTPFIHMAMERGRGADCTTFIGGIYLELGILTEVKYDYYPTNWYIGNPDLLTESVEKHLKEKLIPGLKLRIVVDELNSEPLYRGDLMVVWTWKEAVANHSALFLGDDSVLHCRWGGGVEIRPYSKCWFEKRLVKAYRIERI